MIDMLAILDLKKPECRNLDDPVIIDCAIGKLTNNDQVVGYISALELKVLELIEDKKRIDWLEKTAGWSGIECFCTTQLAFNNEADVRFAFDNAMNKPRADNIEALKLRKKEKKIDKSL